MSFTEGAHLGRVACSEGALDLTDRALVLETIGRFSLALAEGLAAEPTWPMSTLLDTEKI